MSNLLIRNAEVPGLPGVDVRITNGVIAEIGSGLLPESSQVFDAAGGAVIPGLHDHHIHLRALAAARCSVRTGPPEVRDSATFASALRKAAAELAPGQWLRAVGYHESVAGDLDAADLDAIVADRPVRVQHRTGVLWILNTEGMRETGAEQCTEPGVERDGDGRCTGRLWRMDRWLAEHTPRVDVDLLAVGREALARGVTGFTDADPWRTPADVATLSVLPQRLHLMGPVGLVAEPSERVSIGAVKVVLDDDHLPTPDTLAETVAAAHAEARPIAVHCVTRAQLVVTLAALRAVGPGPATADDRIEHASVVPEELVGDLRATGATVVTQPNFVAERGDEYLADVDDGDVPSLYRCRSLIDAGIPVAAGTDAPFGNADPWIAVAAAVERRTPTGAVLGDNERVAPVRALALFLGDPVSPATLRMVDVGVVADLCVLRAPLTEAVNEPSADVVRATIVGGMVAYDADADAR